MKQLFGIAVILATLMALGHTKAQYDASYVKTGDCKERKTCAYNYTAAVYLSNGEEITLSADVKAFCESAGVFNKQTVRRYCIELTNTEVMIANITENGRDDDKSYQKLSDDITNNWFCYVQSTAGKILSVLYPKDDEQEIVNLKKGIVAAFQANFKSTSIEDESDSQSHHHSHYKYSSIGNHKIQQRNINQTDVISFAGNSNISNKSLQFFQHDELELDDNDVVVVSSGNTSFEVGGTAKTDGEDADGLDASKDVPPLAVSTTYKLSLVDCEDDTNHRYTRSVIEYNGVKDSIMAKRNQRKEDLKLLEELHDAILPLDETIVKLNRRDTDSKTKSDLMSTWKQVLEIEAKYGPLPGTQAKLPQIIQRLKNSQRNDSDVRLILYHLLSSEGSLESQKALIEMLHQQLSDEEYDNLLLQIAFLPSVDPSTVDYIQKFLETSNNEQLILSFATLGRHNNVADKIIDALAKKLTTTDDTTDIIHIVHALGNTGSKKIIPLLLPFLSDQTLQLYVIDALRTVSLEESVQKAFTDVVLDAEYPEQVIEVVESLLFPFQHSLYFEELPEISFTEEKLIDALFNACTIKFQDKDLNSVIKKYFNTLSVHSTQQNTKEQLQYYLTRTTRMKRSSTTNWNSNSNSNYNLIAPLQSRTNDEINYPYHKAFLWAKQYGVSDLHLKVAAGAFGGVGSSGLKLFARGRADLRAWKKTFKVIDLVYNNTKSFNSSIGSLLRKYARIAGSTHFSRLIRTFNISYQKSWSRSFSPLKLFDIKYSFFIYVGTLRLYIRGYIGVNAFFYINLTRSLATAYVAGGPVLTITGGARATVLAIFRIGLEASANLNYTLIPIAYAGACEPVDAYGCLKVYSRPGGSINVYAYWQRRTIRCKWFKCKITWKARNKWKKLSYTWHLWSGGSYTLHYGYCKVCNCYNFIFNLICNKSGGGVGNGCSCYNLKLN